MLGVAEMNHKPVPILRKWSPIDKHTNTFEVLSSRKKEQSCGRRVYKMVV